MSPFYSDKKDIKLDALAQISVISKFHPISTFRI